MELIGGLGLFLLGMVVMTDGLRSLAGDAIRGWLIRFTRNAYSGALSGAACTALLQSSSATTVAAVGFVAADLMSYPAALGIIFGANLGTTITGWMVALIGFKLKIGLLALPLVFVGAALRLFGSGRVAALGMTIAGFALIFVGVATMQSAMVDVREVIAFDQWSGNTISDRLMLVAIGAGFTVIAQSSSAGVAATLTALNAGVVDFPQAAALVIGMDVGTTVTALVATAGASVNARRTGLSHVIYNVMTGAAAFLLVPIYINVWQTIAPGALALNAEVALVGFHSCFNALGVIAVLPFTRSFARMMERLVPGDTPSYTQSLDPALLEQSGLAIDAVHASVKLELTALLHLLRDLLTRRDVRATSRLAELQTAIDETHAYLDRIHLQADVGADWGRLLETIHALDHLQRLHERCETPEALDIDGEAPPGLAAQSRFLDDGAVSIAASIGSSRWDDAAHTATGLAGAIRDQKIPFREIVIEGIGAGDIDVRLGTDLLEATRWFRRVSKHIERVTVHMNASVRQHAG